MQDTDAVSCLLCLLADEYGSMIKVCVPPGQIPPSSEKVICQRCADAITKVYFEESGKQIERLVDVESPGVRTEHVGVAPVPSDRDGWDSDLPDRTLESAVEADRSDAENATESSPKRSARRVASKKTDD